MPVLFEDETELRLFPPLRSGWTRQGEPAEVELSGGNEKRVVFGTLSLTGYCVLMVRRKQRAEDFQQFLKRIHQCYRRPVLLLLDGDSSHTAAGSEELAEDLGIELESLPVRSPERNFIEGLWRDAKAVICANHQFSDIEDQVEAFLDYIRSYSNHLAKRKSGLLSDECWLKT